jgi:hypothetical protein
LRAGEPWMFFAVPLSDPFVRFRLGSSADWLFIFRDMSKTVIMVAFYEVP